ncbi:alpha-L-rhamnosidase C-terminal domain-containing protein [Haloferula sp. A504]|uniref:alpha-L-rhamnosidase-related protein n=1 Tax=Haloferula sp. A504 TaxID=3373601 RepID=UPI0031C2A9BB|nr:family 78 glycoside hydrolase catalytic domain [Verrucomicrobiaceae bacterium E54]
MMNLCLFLRSGAFSAVVFLFSVTCLVSAAPVGLVEERPLEIRTLEDGHLWIDFGKVSFGNLELKAPQDAEIVVHFGEAAADGRIDREPPGTVRYSKVPLSMKAGTQIVAPPADKKNTSTNDDRHPPAILTPEEWGVITPFRWVEIEGWPGELKPEQIVRRSAFPVGWDDEAAAFESSNETLDAIWELCRYSIKATSFAGVYVDGDRERIPYEADAYLNQLSHYFVDPDKQMARDTYDRLMEHPTWPTEWAPHMVFMAHADWMHTGDAEWLKPRYEALKGKLLMDRVGKDGLVVSNEKQVKRDDIVDWPKGERDGYVFRRVNTVVNAFHIEALRRMAALADAVGKMDEASEYRMRADKVEKVFNEKLLMKKGVYRDGIGTDHAAFHASMFPLAFGLVPEEQVPTVVRHLVGKGMACSVYAAQYFMEALFENGAGDEALDLILADGDRSWRHMLESGTTITWEAWDHKYKPNQDWNHAWGAAPANLLPRYVLGADPLEPGWEVVGIRPNLGDLTYAKGRVPTVKGPIEIEWKVEGEVLHLDLEVPEGMGVRIDLSSESRKVYVNGSPKALSPKDGWMPLLLN